MTHKKIVKFICNQQGNDRAVALMNKMLIKTISMRQVNLQIDYRTNNHKKQFVDK